MVYFFFFDINELISIMLYIFILIDEGKFYGLFIKIL